MAENFCRFGHRPTLVLGKMKTEADQEKHRDRRFSCRKSSVSFDSVTDAAWTTFMEGELRRKADCGYKRRGEEEEGNGEEKRDVDSSAMEGGPEGGGGTSEGVVDDGEEQRRGAEDDEQLGDGGAFFFLLFFRTSNGKRQNGNIEDRKETLVGWARPSFELG